MPNVDEAAKAWELELAGRIGAAVRARRKALKLTAQQLAERTRLLGYPITRVAISKIEGNMRKGKLDVAELLVLAQALEIPPALLLFPSYPDEPGQVFPDREVKKSEAAVWWFSGRAGHESPGADLVRFVERRADMRSELNNLNRLLTERITVWQKGDARDKAIEEKQRQIQKYERLLEDLEADIQRARNELWGGTEVEANE